MHKLKENTLKFTCSGYNTVHLPFRAVVPVYTFHQQRPSASFPPHTQFYLVLRSLLIQWANKGALPHFYLCVTRRGRTCGMSTVRRSAPRVA